MVEHMNASGAVVPTASGSAGDGPAGPPSPADETPRPGPRSTTASVSLLVTMALLTALVFLRVPYVVSSPGPTRDTLGEHDGVPLIEITGTPTYPSTGELRLTTVSVSGGPDFPVTVPRTVAGWLSDERTVRPVEAVFPPDVSQDQLDQRNQAEMTSSQESATVAALESLGYDVPADLLVAGTVQGTGAAGVLREDDLLESFEGATLTSYTQLLDALAEVDPGQTVRLGVRRDGDALDLEVVTGEREGGGTQLGVFIDPQFDLPVDVTIRIEDIGGPSAGLMFALGIIDRLTPQDEVAGEVVAGTGTMDVDGTVGPIGGIQQKLLGATRDGATWFLAPAGNCEDVVGHVPDGLHVVRVATLAEGRQAMEAIGAGDGASLPTCAAG